ncbi:S9 family peptidase [Sinosporangium siamense]|uniref:Acyl-peptide hydrolase n=1 Tax=Sinosporangium siamense TaxID=1367973 RepID=A0A919V7J0_9ACTN|nr:S9 family peptidase [Sinosporangium siamense]GII95175.1 acyl-peptide hydrolase [Sinosporangium siamense]
MSADLPGHLLKLAAEHYEALGRPGRDVPASAESLAVSPDGRRVGFAGAVADEDGGVAQAACVLDLETQALHMSPGTTLPVWSPDGTRLAWAVQGPDRPTVHVGPWDASRPFTGEAHPLAAGVVESLAWSPDGSRLLVGLAEPGASLSDAFGSGRIPSERTEDDAWRPILSPQHDGDGPRRALVLDPATGAIVRPVDGKTVWQACWAGDRALLCVVSAAPDESAWYTADLVRVDLASMDSTPLPRPAAQVAMPGANQSGSRLSVVAGLMSDRGLDSGYLYVLEPAGGDWQLVDTHGVDVSDQHWIDETVLAYAGLRGLTTVIATYDVTSGRNATLWQSEETCGEPVPTFAAGGGTVAITLHSYARPPALAVIEYGEARVRLDLRAPGAEDVIARAGTMRAVEWEAPDSTLVQGFLAVPDGDGPFPLVAEVHGGPVWAWRNSWMTGDTLTPLLVSAGYAVLHANIRGSTGRGQEFVRAGLKDMCGERDVPDLISGVRHLVDAGLADPDRVAVSGLSYGGLMAAWLVTATDVFAASVSRSPVTEWVSQHYASNLPGFDRMCLEGDPLDPSSDYRTRSPLHRAALAGAPVLLIAGGKDLATPAEQALMYHRALREHGVESELVIYPEEGHGVHDPRALVDHGARILDFLARHLPSK